MHDEVASQVTASAVAVMLIQWLKASKFAPWITAGSDKLNKLIAALLAAATAAGILFTYDSTAHTVTIAGLTLANAGQFIWHWAQSMAFQEVIYKGAIKPEASAGAHPLPEQP